MHKSHIHYRVPQFGCEVKRLIDIIFYLLNRQKYGTSLPEDWKSVIQTRSEMFTIVSQATNCDIIYRQLPKKQEIKPVEESQIMIEDMPRLTNLPWNDEWWMVDVTWVTSTIDIWGQLPNSEYLVTG